VALPPAKPTAPASGAPSADPSDAFFREVTDDLERDKLKGWWDRYGRTLITGISVGLIALAGYLWWDGRQADARIAQADQYVQAVRDMEVGNMAKAKPVFDELTKNGSKGYQALSGLQMAASALTDGNTAQAVKIYDTMAKNTGLPEPLQQFAQLRSVMVQFDTLKPAESIARLTPLAQQGQPWFGTAGELLAIAYLNNNQQDKARVLFEILAKVPRDAKGKPLANDDVPSSVRGRAAQMVQMLGGKIDEPPVPENAAPQ
jgi:hypothetical protein